MLLCTYAGMHGCTSACMDAWRTDAWMHACMHGRMYACIHIIDRVFNFELSLYSRAKSLLNEMTLASAKGFVPRPRLCHQQLRLEQLRIGKWKMICLCHVYISMIIKTVWESTACLIIKWGNPYVHIYSFDLGWPRIPGLVPGSTSPRQPEQIGKGLWNPWVPDHWRTVPFKRRILCVHILVQSRESCCKRITNILSYL